MKRSHTTCVFAGLLATLATVGCGLQPVQPTNSTQILPQNPASTASKTATSASGCVAQGTGEQVLPDPHCTPGATNPQVTQTTIQLTICKHGWTKTVRPPKSYTDRLKLVQMRAYGYTEQNPRDFEEDHLISLELGGAPRDPKNLWPEPGATPNPKDSVERRLNHEVCNGTLSLRAAQTEIASNWTTAR